MRNGKRFYAALIVVATTFVLCSIKALNAVDSRPVTWRDRHEATHEPFTRHVQRRRRMQQGAFSPIKGRLALPKQKIGLPSDNLIAGYAGTFEPRTKDAASRPPKPPKNEKTSFIDISAFPMGDAAAPAQAAVAVKAATAPLLDSSTFPAVPRTLSVVLPCAFEYELMEKTVESVFKATPADVLHEIIVVDDGSSPPLATSFKRSREWKVKMLRHETPRGLIGAKKTGGDAATGDIIVFFDCHVKPDPSYWKPFVSQMKDNYKRVVVPTITNLNVDTWSEFGRPAPGSGGMSKCYITFDSEFKWTTDSTPYVPVMSGGLLAISRQWWTETGGYDAEMVGWGGENIDQSLRIWLCGGEIVSAPESYVAHMWRDGSKPKTGARYSVPPGAPERNRARAAKAHFGAWFTKKTLTFPSFAQFKADGGASLDVSSITAAKSKLKCQPFSWYLDRFSHVYRDGGVLPRTIFQIEAVESGGGGGGGGGGAALCLQMAQHQSWTNAGAPDDSLVLRPCSDKGTTQWWHRANRAARGARKCCTGLRSWNSDQCIVQAGVGGKTSVCDLDSANTMQQVALGADGKLRFTYAGAGERFCLSAAGGGRDGGSVSVGSCATATLWQRRHATTPVEFSILSPEQQAKWPADDIA